MRDLFDRRLAIILLLNAALAVAILQLNALIAPFNMYLTLDALFLIFAALYLRLRHALAAALILALLADSVIPAPYGLSFLTYVVAIAISVAMRPHVRREKPSHLRLVVIVQTFAIILINAMTLAVFAETTALESVWIRTLSDAILSGGFAALVSPLWVRFQEWFFLGFGIDLAAELQRP